jgi:2-dehydropantoate 2-reductase
MYRDLRKGAPVEVDHILGDFIERGGAHGIATRLLEAAFVNLQVYQERLRKR